MVVSHNGFSQIKIKMNNMENGKQKAHPFINKNGDAEQGLTKREYFAGLAMNGYLSCIDVDATMEEVAKYSVKQADLVLKELDKTKSE